MNYHWNTLKLHINVLLCYAMASTINFVEQKVSVSLSVLPWKVKIKSGKTDPFDCILTHLSLTFSSSNQHKIHSPWVLITDKSDTSNFISISQFYSRYNEFYKISQSVALDLFLEHSIILRLNLLFSWSDSIQDKLNLITYLITVI